MILTQETDALTNLAVPKGVAGTHVRTDGTVAVEMPAVVLSRPPMVAAADHREGLFLFIHERKCFYELSARLEHIFYMENKQ